MLLDNIMPQYIHPLPSEALAYPVIPNLIWDPVVCRNVDSLRVFSSGSQIKFGMTITERLT